MGEHAEERGSRLGGIKSLSAAGAGPGAPITAQCLSLTAIFRNLQAPGPGKSLLWSHSLRVTELIMVPFRLYLSETVRLVGLSGATELSAVQSGLFS